MRRFHSYGPVDCRHHFCVDRTELIEKCAGQLAGIPEEGGHYFTIWGPRQTGKTWLPPARFAKSRYFSTWTLFLKWSTKAGQLVNFSCIVF